MANEVRIVVEGSNKSSPAFTQAKKDAKELGAETGKVAEQVKKLTAEISALNLELDRTGDTALFEQIDIKRQELARFQRVAKSLAADLAEGMGEAGQEAGVALSSALADGLRAGKPYLIGAAVGLGLAMSPVLGAVLSAGILGAAGTGGLIGGIVAAAQDPRVEAAASELAKKAAGPLKELGEPFIEPVIGALDRFGTKVRDVVANSELAGGLRGMAGELAPLTRGLEGFVDKFIPGFVKGLKGAEPIIRTLANELPGLGEDIGEMFETLAEDPDGAVMGMKALIDTTGDFLVMVGDVSAALSHTYEDLVRFGAGGAEIFQGLFGWMPVAGDAITETTEGFKAQVEALDSAKGPANQFETDLKDIAGTAEQAAAEFEALGRAIDDVFDPIMDLDQANLRYEQSLVSLQKELAEGARTLDVHTEAGQQNMDGLYDHINLIKGVRDAMATVPEKVDEANASYDRQLEALRKNLLALGYNKDAVNDLINKYKGIPAEVTTEMKYPGLLAAIEAARELRRLLGSNAAAFNQAGYTDVLGGKSSGTYVSGRAHGGIQGAAGGGARGGLSWVGEQGPELVRLPFGSTVIPSGTSRAMAEGQMSGASGGTTYVVIDIQGTDDDHRRRIQKLVNVYGDGNVQVAFGKASASSGV